MAQILVLYSTIEGQTRKIARAIAGRIRAHGHTVRLLGAESLNGPLDAECVDAAIIGGSVHAGRHPDALMRVVADNRDVLDTIPTAFFSVSLTAAHADPEARAEARGPVNAFAEDTGWTPTLVETVAGALRYSQYGFLKKQLLRWISWRSGGPTDTSSDHELTDWPRVDRFVDRFLHHVSTIERLRTVPWAGRRGTRQPEGRSDPRPTPSEERSVPTPADAKAPRRSGPISSDTRP